MTEVNITIFSYYNDLCVHNFNSRMSFRRSLIGRLGGPLRGMTEYARETRVSAAIPASAPQINLGQGNQLLNFLLTWSLLMKYKEEEIIFNFRWSWSCKWLPRVLETRKQSPLATSIQRQQYCNLQWLWLPWLTWLILPPRIGWCIFRNVKKMYFLLWGYAKLSERGVLEQILAAWVLDAFWIEVMTRLEGGCFWKEGFM